MYLSGCLSYCDNTQEIRNASDTQIDASVLSPPTDNLPKKKDVTLNNINPSSAEDSKTLSATQFLIQCLCDVPPSTSHCRCKILIVKCAAHFFFLFNINRRWKRRS